jgi:hypothetical protein
MKNDFIDPLEVYVDSIRAEILEVDVILPQKVIEAEPSILGLSPEMEEEAIFTLFFN